MSSRSIASLSINSYIASLNMESHSADRTLSQSIEHTQLNKNKRSKVVP